MFAWPRAVHRYREWNAQRHVRSASEFFAKGDFRRAVLSANAALEHSPLDAGATRIIAKSLESLGVPASAEWRTRLDMLLPGDPENILARARAALKTKGVESAEQMMNGLAPADRNSAGFHDLAALIALGKRDVSAAEKHWAEACRMEPANALHQVNLSRIRLESRAPGVRDAALGALEDLRAKPMASVEALRLLLSDALRTRDAAKARAMADALVADARSTFYDKLTRLDALRQVRDPRSGPYLLELRDGALAEPANLHALLMWMNGKDLSMMVTEWARDLPAESISKPPLGLTVAEAYAKTGDWKKLRELAGSSTWSTTDYLRRAFLTCALERLGETDEATREWTAAVAAARSRTDAMERLAKFALTWKWDRRAEEIMWPLTARPQCPQWVADSLWKLANQRGETAQLQKLSAVLAKLDPKGIAARNNYAFLSLLTRTDEGHPHRTAERLHREHPDNALVASTYGLSLYQQGRAAEAVALMSMLKAEDVRQPQVALYYAIFLLAAGENEKAEEYLKLSAGSPMLPEEKALLDRAIAAASKQKELPGKPSAPAAADDKNP